MTKITDFIRTKSIMDTSMAMGLKMIEENIDQQEDCILLLFQAIYETNKKLADEVVKLRQKAALGSVRY